MERVLQKIIVSKSSSRLSAAAVLLLLAACPPSPDVETRITHVTDGYFGRSLAESMEANKVPGVSITVIDDYEIEWARGFGVLSVDGNKKVTPETLFPASSISKGVTSAIALTLVEQGLLDLAENVNERLTSWRIPENEFTEKEKVTLLRLLDHTACVNRPEGGFGHAENYPSTIQILNGESPATNHAARIVCVPGSEIRYSNIGYVIVQQLIDDVSGPPFAELAMEALFKPIGIESSTFEQPLPKPLEQLAAMPHDLEGKPEPLSTTQTPSPKGGSGQYRRIWPVWLAKSCDPGRDTRTGFSPRTLQNRCFTHTTVTSVEEVSGDWDSWYSGFGCTSSWLRSRVQMSARRVSQNGQRYSRNAQWRRRRIAPAGDTVELCRSISTSSCRGIPDSRRIRCPHARLPLRCLAPRLSLEPI
ncbi:MAG TPA: serine hydrolase domain-containing protein [Acidobacteriota bacterium]|nr:serine hydrolase domain-containing protein [Acidobacteriota bacterium]